MKIRQGFVSNSSSSSFIVKMNDERFPKPTSEQIKKLRKFGFKLAVGYYPWSVTYQKANQQDPGPLCFAYEILCNQDEVIEFLVKNRISFLASTHYEDHGIIYHGGKDIMLSVDNPMRRLMTEGEFDKGIVGGVTRTKGKDWLREN